jgi:hypothetical protein
MPLNFAVQVPIYGSAVQRSEWRNMFYRLNIPKALRATAAPQNGAAPASRDLVRGTRARDSGRFHERFNTVAYFCHR